MNLEKWRKFQSSCPYNKNNDNSIFGYCDKYSCKCSFFNCNKTKTDPFISTGKNTYSIYKPCKKVGNALTDRELEALRYRNQKSLSYAIIGKNMKISKKRAYVLVQNAIKKIGGNDYKKDIINGGNDKLGGVTKAKKKGVTFKNHKINLHNDSISLECIANVLKIDGKLINLKYTSYKLIKTPDHIIKIFNKKIVIQFRKDIEALTIAEVYSKATKRINNYVNSFFIPYVELNKKEVKQLSRHYSILGTSIAKKYIKEGKKLFIYDDYDKKERVRIDYSDKDKAGGLPHFEFTHPIKSKIDADSNKRYIESIINHKHYLPHESKAILDVITSTQLEYAENIKLHLKVLNKIEIVQSETLTTLKKIQNNLN